MKYFHYRIYVTSEMWYFDREYRYDPSYINIHNLNTTFISTFFFTSTAILSTLLSLLIHFLFLQTLLFLHRYTSNVMILFYLNRLASRSDSNKHKISSSLTIFKTNRIRILHFSFHKTFSFLFSFLFRVLLGGDGEGLTRSFYISNDRSRRIVHELDANLRHTSTRSCAAQDPSDFYELDGDFGGIHD